MIKVQPEMRENAAQPIGDEELLVRYRDHGDVAAFEELVHRYERPIYNYLLRYLHNAQLAEDVFQSTFLRLHQKRHLYESGRPVRPWLYTMATHRAVDALRTEGRQQAVSLDEQHFTADSDAAALVDLLASKSATPPVQLDREERRQWTRKVVAELPEHLRVVVLLIYFQGLKYHEVAEVLGIPLGTVKSRAHKALVELNSAWHRDHAHES